MANPSAPLGRVALDGENVIPKYTKIPAESTVVTHASYLFDPSRVNTRTATGGFNSVFEITAATCLRVLKNNLSLSLYNIQVKAKDLIEFLSAQGSLHSSQLNRILSATDIGNYTFSISFIPAALQFIDDKNLAIKLVAYVELKEPLHREASPVKKEGLQHDQTVAAEYEPGIHSVVNIIGNWSSFFEMELQCAYDFISDPRLSIVDVYALLSTASVNYTLSAPDMKMLFDQYFTAHTDSIRQIFTQHTRIAICPVISVPGANSFNTPVQEIGIFDVSVFPVSKAGGKVLAIAFNLRQGCRGTDDFVRDFIGDSDYGIISDEYLVERVVKFRWRLGGFRRTLYLESQFQARSSDNRELTGTLKGFLSLESLDNVSIECDSNTRTDYIRLGGNASSQATSIGLDSGEQLDPKSLELGPPADVPWNLFTSLELDQSLSTQNELRQFQIDAHQQVYQYLGRPFRHFPAAAAAELVYARTEGVSKQIYLLGHIPTIFK